MANRINIIIRGVDRNTSYDVTDAITHNSIVDIAFYAIHDSTYNFIKDFNWNVTDFNESLKSICYEQNR